MATTTGLREVRQESTWREVSAVLLRPPPPQFYGYGSMSTYWVAGPLARAVWRDPARHDPGQVGHPARRPGQRLGDRSGALTGRHPMTPAMVRLRSALIEMGAVAALALVLCAVAGVAAAMLNRRRMLAWGIDWACFGPRWTTRRWPRS